MARKRVFADTPHRSYLLPRVEFIRPLVDARVPPKADRRKGVCTGQVRASIGEFYYE